MNLYLLTQFDTSYSGSYEGIIVVAKSEQDARMILPDVNLTWETTKNKWATSPENVMVRCLGKARSDFEEDSILLKSKYE